MYKSTNRAAKHEAKRLQIESSPSVARMYKQSLSRFLSLKIVNDRIEAARIKQHQKKYQSRANHVKFVLEVKAAKNECLQRAVEG